MLPVRTSEQNLATFWHARTSKTSEFEFYLILNQLIKETLRRREAHGLTG